MKDWLIPVGACLTVGVLVGSMAYTATGVRDRQRYADEQAFFAWAKKDNQEVNACLAAGGFPIKTWGAIAGTGVMIYRDCRMPCPR